MEFAKLKPDKGVLSYAWNHQAHIATGPHFHLYVGQNTIDHKQVVIKQVDNTQLTNPEAFSGLLAEIQAIKAKNLQGCIQYYDLARSHDSFFFIQSFANQGDLRKYMQNKGKINEDEAITIVQSLIKSLQSLRNEGLFHGNLKPENIQIHNKGYLLNDFSLFNYYPHFLSKDQQPFEETLYHSPQSLSSSAKNPYKINEKHDIWAVGIIFYELLYASLPWPAKSKAEYLQTMKKIPIRFPFNLVISEKSKDFLRSCLQIEENARFSLEKALKHPLMGGEGESSAGQQAKFSGLSSKSVKIIKDLQNVITKQSLDLEKLFLGFDKTGDKALDQHEFLKLLYVMQPKVDLQDVQELFQKFDENHDGSINLIEFKKLVLETDFQEKNDNEQLAEFRGQKLLDHIINIIIENSLDLEKMIGSFDVTGDHLLKFGEFLPIIRVFDREITDQDARFVFKKFDRNVDGEISYEELRTILELELEKRKSNKKEKKKEVFTVAEKILEDLKRVIVLNKLDIKMVFKSFDKSGDGMLDFKEFKELVAIINARNTEESVRELFQLFDANGDQNVSLDEFQKHLLAN